MFMSKNILHKYTQSASQTPRLGQGTTSWKLWAKNIKESNIYDIYIMSLV